MKRKRSCDVLRHARVSASMGRVVELIGKAALIPVQTPPLAPAQILDRLWGSTCAG